jgi:hypothetical protein
MNENLISQFPNTKSIERENSILGTSYLLPYRDTSKTLVPDASICVCVWEFKQEQQR